MTDDILRKNIERSIEVHSHLLEACLPAMAAAADALISAYRSGHKALFFGNGGSAADAQHLAAEFVGRYLRERRPMPALALQGNTSAVTWPSASALRGIRPAFSRPCGSRARWASAPSG